MRAEPDSGAVSPEAPNIWSLLASRARRMSDAKRVCCAALSVVATLLLATRRPAWGMYALPVVALGTFGLEGNQEREQAVSATRFNSVTYHHAIIGSQSFVVGPGTVAALVTGVRHPRNFVGNNHLLATQVSLVQGAGFAGTKSQRAS